MTLGHPWYRDFSVWAERANEYLAALRNIPEGAPHHKELSVFAEFSQAQLIFESNLIEGAGLSEGETRKVVSENCPRLPDTYEAFRDAQYPLQHYITFAGHRLETLRQAAERAGLSSATVIPSYMLAERARPILEVVRHFSALLYCHWRVADFRYRNSIYGLVQAQPEHRTDPQFLSLISEEPVDLDTMPVLITEDFISDLHKRIATNLLPADAGVPAGSYRIDSRAVGWEIVFPSPELVPLAMKRFATDSNESIGSALINPGNAYRVAAQVSYELVRIHPFPDFNGRLSRLLLMMVLNACGVPFPVTVRGDPKSRKRYFRSLKVANGGNIDPYATLIAMRVVDAFVSIDKNLAIAGLPSILTFGTATPAEPHQGTEQPGR